MIEPFVCCITPTRDRPEYLRRTIECFKAQTYPYKGLVIWDTGSKHENYADHQIHHGHAPNEKTHTIGWIRNRLIDLGLGSIIAHFDDDDWSAPTRLAEQVAFMQSSGASVVGYCDMPFYDEVRDRVLFYSQPSRNYALGTSLMYKREVWERTPFPDTTPEDTTWQRQVGPANIASCSSLRVFSRGGSYEDDVELRMIQTIHKGNACPKTGARFAPASPELDKAVRSILEKAKVCA